MSQPSTELDVFIAALQRHRRVEGSANATDAATEVCNLLRQIGDFGNPTLMPCVASYLVETDPQVQQTARNTIHRLLSQLTQLELMSAYQLFHFAAGWYTRDTWDKIKPSDLDKVSGPSGHPEYTSVLGLLTFHESGYVRHEALRKLSVVFDGTEFPYLLIRQNDWVDQIAEDAQVAVQERLATDDAKLLDRSLEIIIRMVSLKRQDHLETTTRVMSILLKEANHGVLQNAVNSASRIVGRQLIRLGLERSGRHLEKLVLLAIKSSDPVVRLAGCRRLATVFNVPQAIDLLDGLTKDHHMVVRREAYRQIEKLSSTSITHRWVNALNDRHLSIRRLARWQLAQQGINSTSKYYREKIRTSPDCLSAIAGLAETGSPKDLPFLRKLSKHPSPRRRCIAVKGLIRIGKESELESVFQLLQDRSRRVIQTVKGVIDPYLALVSRSDLFDLATTGSTEATRLAAVGIFANMSKWESLSWLVRIAAKTNGETTEYAEKKIYEISASNSVFTQPSQTVVEDITETVQQAQGNLPDETKKIVLAELKRFTKQ